MMIIEILISGRPSCLHQLISHASLYCIKYFSGLSSALHKLISHVSLYCIKYFSGLSSALHQLFSHVSLYCIKYFSGLSSALHKLISHVSLYCVKYYLYICVCAWFAVITVYVLFVGRQSISCDYFLAHLAKGNVSFCHHLASVIC